MAVRFPAMPFQPKLTEALQGLVDFVAVDCDQDKNKPLCQEYGVQVRSACSVPTPPHCS